MSRRLNSHSRCIGYVRSVGCLLSRSGYSPVYDATLDATDNWWGHASGPGGPDGRWNPAGREVGRGDDIEGDVAFDPWLRRPIDSPSR
ncbi:hypothetical protein [Halobacteriaceae bacterium SHR40]|uniref:hypothetical protein n=1 Tax=Halovenus amylolytica TaxID=2500550 RepID=UPI000FE4360C